MLWNCSPKRLPLPDVTCALKRAPRYQIQVWIVQRHWFSCCCAQFVLGGSWQLSPHKTWIYYLLWGRTITIRSVSCAGLNPLFLKIIKDSFGCSQWKHGNYNLKTVLCTCVGGGCSQYCLVSLCTSSLTRGPCDLALPSLLEVWWVQHAWAAL